MSTHLLHRRVVDNSIDLLPRFLVKPPFSHVLQFSFLFHFCLKNVNKCHALRSKLSAFGKLCKLKAHSNHKNPLNYASRILIKLYSRIFKELFTQSEELILEFKNFVRFDIDGQMIADLIGADVKGWRNVF